MPKPVPVYLDSHSAAYRSPDEAAHGVASSFDTKSNTEQAAIILRGPDGSHTYSTVAPQLEHDNFALSAQLPKGYSLSGIVHSHLGDDHDGQLFSPRDVEVANQLKVPSYIRFMSTGAIRKYVPGQTSTQKYGQWQQAAVGDPLQIQQESPLSQVASASIESPLSQVTQ